MQIIYRLGGTRHDLDSKDRGIGGLEGRLRWITNLGGKRECRGQDEDGDVSLTQNALQHCQRPLYAWRLARGVRRQEPGSQESGGMRQQPIHSGARTDRPHPTAQQAGNYFSGLLVTDVRTEVILVPITSPETTNSTRRFI